VQYVTQRKVVEQTVRQNVIHIHQTIRQQIIRQRLVSASYLRQEAFLVMLPRERRSGRELEDMSRPARAARRLMRIFSKESARRELQPFYSTVVRNVLREEQDRYRSRPGQAISLIWNLFGRQQAFRTLTRFYMSAVEKLGSNYYPALSGPNALYLATGVLLHSRVYRQYVQQLWRSGTMDLPVHYAPRQRLSSEELDRLEVVRRVLPPRQVVEQLEEHTPPEAVHSAPETAEQSVRLSEADFRALVQGVAQSLGRETRLEALRRGRF